MITSTTQSNNTNKRANQLLMVGLLTLSLAACNDNDNEEMAVTPEQPVVTPR